MATKMCAHLPGVPETSRSESHCWLPTQCHTQNLRECTLPHQQIGDNRKPNDQKIHRAPHTILPISQQTVDFLTSTVSRPYPSLPRSSDIQILRSSDLRSPSPPLRSTIPFQDYALTTPDFQIFRSTIFRPPSDPRFPPTILVGARATDLKSELKHQPGDLEVVDLKI